MIPLPRLPYAQVRGAIRDGDVLLFRARGAVAAVIRWATRSEFSHAALAVWVRPSLEDRSRDRLMLVESREGSGCRMVPLSSAVKGNARISVYLPERVTLEQRAAAVADALDRLGQPYGWRAILRDALGRLPLLSLVLRRRQFSTDDLELAGARVKCSTLVSAAWRAAGLDLVPNLADRSTDPGDLARSAALSGAAELVP